MPQYSLGQLVTRANAGNIGNQGRAKLRRLGVDPSTLGHAVQNAVAAPAQDPAAAVAHTVASQVAPAGQTSPEQTAMVSRAQATPADLQARRALLYGRAAQAAASGGPLSAGIQHRLALGVGNQPLASQIVAPRSQAGVQGLGQGNVASILDLIRRRRGAVSSNAGIYNY